MSAIENKKLLEHIFEQMAAGNTSSLSDAMADEFRWVFPGGWSWSGTWAPKAVVLKELLRAADGPVHRISRCRRLRHRRG
ncbi:hypothetical protein [Nocardia sp. NPDC050175]|uniref:hypothetical protein n=1 Tax=Nocardia sp. NPDC050175 TaxID=3364317 RepID=UPI00379B6974